MIKPTYIEMAEVLNTYWISRSQMRILLPQLSKSKCDEEFNKILNDMKKNNEAYFETRPILIPIDKVIDKFKINKAYILKEAKRMEKGWYEKVEKIFSKFKFNRMDGVYSINYCAYSRLMYCI